MESFPHPMRRALMMSLAGLTLGSATPLSATTAEGSTRGAGSPILVAYFSRTGNTRVVAGLIRRALGADMFEILPATPYPEEYLATVEQARQERDRGIEPTLKATVTGIARYAMLFLGFPIWGETAPPIIRSFLSAHELSDKTLVPFITHGGYGSGNNRGVAQHAPRGACFVVASRCRQTRNGRTMDRVKAGCARCRPCDSKRRGPTLEAERNKDGVHFKSNRVGARTVRGTAHGRDACRHLPRLGEMFLHAEQSGIKLAIIIRTVTLVLLGAWLVGTRAQDPIRALGYAVVLTIFAALGLIHYVMIGTRFDQRWVKYVFVTLDIAIVSALVATRPLSRNGYRSARGYDLPRFHIHLLFRHPRPRRP